MQCMVLAVLAAEAQKEEWNKNKLPATVTVFWADSLQALLMLEADAYFDLQYEWTPERNEQYHIIKGKPIFVNEVVLPCSFIGAGFARINAWPGMLQRPIQEIAVHKNADNQAIITVLQAMGWQYQLVPDIVGMLSARIIATIINEAFFTLGSGVSSKEAIDTAMKLGTNYPYGPFEWTEIIGKDRIIAMLKELSRTDTRYEPAPALLNL
jgi:3-hydroxybutyryl-CoA dehydrogenase